MRPLILVGPVTVAPVSSAEHAAFRVGRRDGADVLTVVLTEVDTPCACAPMAGDVARALAASVGHPVLMQRAVRAVRRGAA